MDCGDWKFGGNGSFTCVRKPSEEAEEHQRICKEKGFETAENPKPKEESEKKPTK
jgi:hypothetical protein